MTNSYLVMTTDAAAASDLIDSDLRKIGVAAKNLAGWTWFWHFFFKWLASFDVMYVINILLFLCFSLFTYVLDQFSSHELAFRDEFGSV